MDEVAANSMAGSSITRSGVVTRAISAVGSAPRTPLSGTTNQMVRDQVASEQVVKNGV